MKQGSQSGGLRAIHSPQVNILHPPLQYESLLSIISAYLCFFDESFVFDLWYFSLLYV